MSQRSHKLSIVFLSAIILAGAFASGFFVGKGAESKVIVSGVTGLDGKPADVNFEPFWNAWSVVSQKYVSKNGNTASSTTVTVSSQQKVWGAIEGFVKSLGDPYTVFFTPSEAKIFQSSIQGDFEGVGMEVSMKNGVLTVIAPLKGSPAEKAGIKSGDQIYKINGEASTDLTVDEAVQKIRGPKGTNVVVNVLRDGASTPIDITITRDVIKLPTLDTQENSSKVTADGKVVPAEAGDIKDGVFVVHLYSFTATAGDEFATAMNRMSKSGAKKLVIDLRGNPGGYLDAAVDIASWFIPKGLPVVSEKNGSGLDLEYASKGYELPTNVKSAKVVLLVDKGTASASEILAGALSEYGKATIVGEKTFGKGSVQEVVDFNDGSALKVTIARWYTPKGRSISLSGLEPDVKISLTAENTKNGADPQMAKAIEVLNK
jgi:carboxyl-terminal processing protease